MSIESFKEYLATLPPEVRSEAVKAARTYAFSQDYSLYAEHVLLADEHGQPGRLAAWQKKIVGMPLGASVIAVTGRQL